jgi:cation diffusion facilitator CzcD-associated flavoprotein CzcO
MTIPKTDDCIVVGAGPAGLAMSEALTERGVSHRVLERGEVGHSWRTQRWAGLRLNSPGWLTGRCTGKETTTPRLAGPSSEWPTLCTGCRSRPVFPFCS